MGRRSVEQKAVRIAWRVLAAYNTLGDYTNAASELHRHVWRGQLLHARLSRVTTG